MTTSAIAPIEPKVDLVGGTVAYDLPNSAQAGTSASASMEVPILSAILRSRNELIVCCCYCAELHVHPAGEGVYFSLCDKAECCDYYYLRPLGACGPFVAFGNLRPLGPGEGVY